MAAKESEAMKKARKLVTEKGLTPYAAAQKVGLTRSAIYMAHWYKEWRNIGAPLANPEQMVEIKMLIMDMGLGVHKVAKKFGVNPESIYQSEWYKDWIAE